MAGTRKSTTSSDTTPEQTEQAVVETTDGERHEGTLPESAAVADGTAEPNPVVAAAEQTDGEPSSPDELPDETTLDSDNTRPSTTAPGDGPADTTDPRELASSAPFYPGPDALAAGTVNAVQKVGTVPDPDADRDSSHDRIEKYDTTNALGQRVTVTHNLETGATSVTAAE